MSPGRYVYIARFRGRFVRVGWTKNTQTLRARLRLEFHEEPLALQLEGPFPAETARNLLYELQLMCVRDLHAAFSSRSRTRVFLIPAAVR